MQYVAIFATQYISSLSSFVPNFNVLTQVVAEKSLTEKCPYVLFKIDSRKKRRNEKRRPNEDKQLNLPLHSTLCLPKGVHKILKQWLQ